MQQHSRQHSPKHRRKPELLQHRLMLPRSSSRVLEINNVLMLRHSETVPLPRKLLKEPPERLLWMLRTLKRMLPRPLLLLLRPRSQLFKLLTMLCQKVPVMSKPPRQPHSALWMPRRVREILLKLFSIPRREFSIPQKLLGMPLKLQELLKKRLHMKTIWMQIMHQRNRNSNLQSIHLTNWILN